MIQRVNMKSPSSVGCQLQAKLHVCARGTGTCKAVKHSIIVEICISLKE